MAKLEQTYTNLTYKNVTTGTSSKCCLIVGYNYTVDRSTAKYTINFLTVVGGGTTLFYAGGNSSGALTVNGTQIGYASPSPGSSWATNNSYTVGGTTYNYLGYLCGGNGSIQSTTVQGSFSGTTSVSVSFKYVGGGNAYGLTNQTHTLTGTITLPKVQGLTSTVSNNSTSNSRINFGDNVTFSISSQSSTATHTLTYKVGDTTYTIGSGLTTGVSYAFPTSLINSFANTATPNIVVTCTNNESNTTSSTTVYLQVPSSYEPTVSATLTSDSYWPDGWGGNTAVLGPRVIKGISTMNISVTAAGSAGSTISKYSTKVDNVGTFDKTNFNTGVLKTAGRQSAVVTVTDTRGRTASTEKEFYVIDYAAPSLSKLTCIRCNANGEPSESGTYGKLSFTYNVHPGEFDTNYFSIYATCNGTEIALFDNEDTDFSGNYTSGVLFSNLSTEAAYPVEIYVVDCLSGSEGMPLPKVGLESSFLPSAVTVSKLAGGRGIDFGQTATAEGFHCHYPATFHNGTNINGSLFVADAQGNNSVNVMTRIDAVENKCVTVFVQSTQPTSGKNGDIWFSI